MAVFITGDTHGDFTRFKKDIFYEQAELTKDDCVIIAGDFGGIWDGSRQERHWLDWLEAKPFTTLFVSGNHENFDLLAEFPTEDWHGGKVQHIRPSVIHLLRGRFTTSKAKPSSQWEAGAATILTAASWNRTIRSLRGNAGCLITAEHCTG